MPTRRNDRRIADLIKQQDWDGVASLLARTHPADIADLIDSAPAEQRDRLFSLLGDDAKPDVLAEVESDAGTELLHGLTDSEISDIVEDMAPDDAADILGDLSEERGEHVLDLMEEEESREVRKLLEYDDDTAGGIMTTDVVAMSEDETVGQALEAIAHFDPNERFFHANVVDSARRLLGYVDVWELLREQDRTRRLSDLLHRDFVAGTVDMDQEEVASLMNKYDLAVVPIVDGGGTLVGRVTADDVIDVMQEEASEDIFRLAGSDDAELESWSATHSSLLRLPWLMITLLGGFLTSMILKQFLSHVTHVMALAYFVPIVLAMGGNVGIQSSTLIVRRIALGRLEGRSVLHLLLKEVLVGVMMGVVCGTVMGLWARYMVGDTTAVPPLGLAATVAVALFSAMTFAATFGALVPIALNRLRIDPAVASGPFITIANDIFALLIYFGITALLLRTFS